MFEPQVSAFRKQYRCVSWDHRGQGDSEVPPGRICTIESCTDDAIALLEALDCGPVHFVGLSMGGFVGMRIAARRPDLIASLSLLETAADAEPIANVSKYKRLNFAARWMGMNRFLAKSVMPIMFGKTFMSDPNMAELNATWRAELMRNKFTIYKAVNGVIERESVLSEMANITVRTQVVHGDEDVAIARTRAQATCDAIPGAKWVTIPRAGHTSSIENSDAVTEALRSFILNA
ncbi:MAG: alpha/beta fold hydrolase [Rhodobacterales bacterium]|nr:alpha/beta fold hydrolase [Rhodobacterales bacterium]